MFRFFFNVERRKVRLQIILENDREAEKITDIFNSLKDDINKGLSGIEFIVATQGSIILNVDIFIEMMETDQILRSTLVLFLERVLEHIETHMIGNINVVLLPIEGMSFMLHEWFHHDLKKLSID